MELGEWNEGFGSQTRRMGMNGEEGGGVEEES